MFLNFKYPPDSKPEPKSWASNPTISSPNGIVWVYTFSHIWVVFRFRFWLPTNSSGQAWVDPIPNPSRSSWTHVGGSFISSVSARHLEQD